MRRIQSVFTSQQCAFTGAFLCNATVIEPLELPAASCTVGLDVHVMVRHWPGRCLRHNEGHMRSNSVGGTWIQARSLIVPLQPLRLSFKYENRILYRRFSCLRCIPGIVRRVAALQLYVTMVAWSELSRRYVLQGAITRRFLCHRCDCWLHPRLPATTVGLKAQPLIQALTRGVAIRHQFIVSHAFEINQRYAVPRRVH
jgi:hypothetical protein